MATAYNDPEQYQYYQKPVNFGDFSDPYPGSKTRTADASSLATHATSGILVLDTSDHRDEHGQSAAERVASEYLSSPSPNSSSSSGTAVARSRSIDASSQFGRKSVAPSNLDAMTYIDEDFNYYSSRKPSEADDKNDSSLIGDAAGMGRSDGARSMADLGKGGSNILRRRSSLTSL